MVYTATTGGSIFAAVPNALFAPIRQSRYHLKEAAAVHRLFEVPALQTPGSAALAADTDAPLLQSVRTC